MKDWLDQMKHIVAQRLKEARETAGMTQAQVARHLELTRPTVMDIEAGRRHVRAQELRELAVYYGVSVDWILNL